MLGKLIVPKYLDPGNPLVNVDINKTLIQNSLIYLGVSINILTKDTMLNLNLQGFLKIKISFPISKNILSRDIILSIDSWEYSTDFLVLQTDSKFNGYPLILGRPWLAKTYAYIGCKENIITLIVGQSQKLIVLYPLPKI
jgi:hypothetical protein